MADDLFWQARHRSYAQILSDPQLIEQTSGLLRFFGYADRPRAFRLNAPLRVEDASAPTGTSTCAQVRILPRAEDYMPAAQISDSDSPNASVRVEVPAMSPVVPRPRPTV